MKQYRQGDLYLTQIDELPKGVKLTKTLILLKGESTGHSHRLNEGSIFLKGDLMYLALAKNSSLVHEEHDTIKLPKGFYAITRQKEYVSSDMVKLVVD